MRSRDHDAERPAGGGERHAIDRVRLREVEHLEGGVVFGVHRNDDGTRTRKRVAENIAGGDDAFLVGERDGGAAFHRGQRRRERGRADDADHHDIGRPRSRFRDGVVAAGRFDAGSGERVFQLRQQLFIADHGDARTEFARLLGQHIHLVARRQRFDRHGVRPVGGARMAHDIERAQADGAGAAQKRQTPRGETREIQSTQLA